MTNARAGLKSCEFEVQEELWAATAICAFEPDWNERKECLSDASDERSEKRDECRDVFDARRELCEQTNPGPYAPDFEPEDFDSDFSALTNPNPYMPLGIGNRWRYESDDGEEIFIEVKSATKRIEGVTCITVNDRAEQDGFVIEDTEDWQAQAKDGAVHYCGEISRNFELFEGDDPLLPELVDVDGSWKVGRDDAKPGILMLATPVPGTTYRQEFAFGDAEDAATVLSNAYGYGNGEELDDSVPEALADHFCANEDCVVTLDFTPLSPGSFERKYYARGVGLFLEVDVEGESFVPLVECNFHTLCSGIPDVSSE